MLRALAVTAIAGALLGALFSCGGSAFSIGPDVGDAGGTHDSAPPMDSGPDAITPVDANGEAPPSCSGDFTCVPAVPSGWTGPLEVYAGMGAPPSCTTGFAESVGAFDMLQAPDAACTCACGASKTTCTAPDLLFYGSTTCNAGAVSCATATLTPDACTTLNELPSCAPATLLDVTILGGSSTTAPCAPEASSQVPAYSWGIQARGCTSTIAPAQVDCHSGQICAPRPEMGFGPKLCVSHPGDLACPAGAYAVKHTFFTAVDDRRGCTSCTCGVPGGGSCSYSIDSYQSSDGSCTGGANIYMPGDACAGVAQPGDFRLTETSVGGSCAPSASVPTGSATPAGPITVCCPM